MSSPTGVVCPHCGWPDGAERFQVVSARPTATGGTLWTRCAAFAPGPRVVDEHGTRVVSRGGPLPGGLLRHRPTRAGSERGDPHMSEVHAGAVISP